MARRLILLVALALAVVLAACGSGGDGQATTAQTATAGQATTPATSASAPPPECKKVAQPKPSRVRLPAPNLKLDPGKTYRAVVDTSCGSFTITLDAQSPKTAASFAYLAQKGFYDKTTFHRIIRGFVIQGGDPLGTGLGGPGYSVIEPPPRGTRYIRGIVAMAKTETEAPGTSGSQFYVVTGEDAGLPPDYAVAGRVTAGMDVVTAIEAVPTNQGSADPSSADRPLAPVVINRVTIR